MNGGVFKNALIASSHARERFIERIDETISYRDAKSEIELRASQGTIIGYHDEENEIVIRHLDALFVCKPGDNNVEETVVATTLNHFMNQRSLDGFRK